MRPARYETHGSLEERNTPAVRAGTRLLSERNTPAVWSAVQGDDPRACKKKEPWDLKLPYIQISKIATSPRTVVLLYGDYRAVRTVQAAQPL